MTALKKARRILCDKYSKPKSLYSFYLNLNRYTDEVHEGKKDMVRMCVHSDEIGTSIALYLTE